MKHILTKSLILCMIAIGAGLLALHAPQLRLAGLYIGMIGAYVLGQWDTK